MIVITHFGPGNEFNSLTASSTTGILDLANPWVPSTLDSPSAKVRITKTSGQIVESTFATSLTTGSVSSVDQDTTPRLYVFQNPSAVNNFVSQSIAGDGNADIEIEFSIPIIQSVCDIPSGQYLNHVRFTDSTGVSYVDAFKLIYSVPENVQGADSCDQATITFEN